MATKVTPLYTETLILLKLWALDTQPAYKSSFNPSLKKEAYAVVLSRLVEDGAITAIPKGKTNDQDRAITAIPKGKTSDYIYSIAESGKMKLAEGLADPDFVFTKNVGVKTTNPLLKWLRQSTHLTESTKDTNHYSVNQSGSLINGSVPKIDSYEEFSKTALETYDQLNQDYNLGDLVPIYRIRREMGDRLSRREFNDWLLKVQKEELVQLMGGELPGVTPDQLEDSVAIPDIGTRFYVKRLQ